MKPRHLAITMGDPAGIGPEIIVKALREMSGRGDADRMRLVVYGAPAILTEAAEARGLRAVPTLTKTRTDVLVVAEAGSQSTKAKNAARWEKPVITAEEFLEWVG